MEVILCSCAWEIPGIESLPPHQHYTFRKIRRTGDGREVITHCQWIEQAGYEVLCEFDDISIAVDWKALARVR